MNIHEKIVVGEGNNGDFFEVEKITIRGAKREISPSVYIQSSMHAAELQGNLVIFHLLDYLEKHPPLGDISIISHCNPLAMNNMSGSFTYGRYDPMDGSNWNRYYFKSNIDFAHFSKKNISNSFESYKKNFRKLLVQEIDDFINKNSSWKMTRSQILATSLQRHALNADIVLDLHTDKKAIDYVYSPEYSKESSSELGFPHVFLIPNISTGSLDEAIFSPWWSLQQSFLKLGRTDDVAVDAFTIELGSEGVINNNSSIRQVRRILNYLSYKKVLKFQSSCFPDLGEISSKVSFYSFLDFEAFHAPYGGIYEWFITPGQCILKNQIIGRCLKTYNQSTININSPCDSTIISINAEGSIPKGTHIFNLAVKKNY